MFFQLLAIVGTLLAFVAATLSVASGLYYVSEIIEDNLSLTTRILRRLLSAICLVLVLLCLFDDLPFKLGAFSLLSNYLYHRALANFPNKPLPLSSFRFLSIAALAIANHVLWFRHFSHPYIPSIDERLSPGFVPPHYPSFPEIASFFAICVWLFPFSLFIALSSNENGLPTITTTTTTTTTSSPSPNNISPASTNLIKRTLGNLTLYLDSLFAIFGLDLKLHKSKNDTVLAF